MQAITAALLSSPGSLLAALTSANDRQVVTLALRGRVPVQLCASAGELLQRLRATGVATRGIVAVVLDLDAAGARAALPVILAEIEGTPVPLLLRLTLTKPAIRTILSHTQAFAQVRLSVRECDSLNDDLVRLLAPPAALVPLPSARLAIVSRSATVVAGAALQIVTTAAIIGVRPVSVSALAGACQLGSRTLQLRLAAGGLMAPKPLLQWMLALHTVWGVTFGHKQPSSMAVAMGLRSADVLSDRVERVTGMRLAAVCRILGFEGLMERFVATLVVRRLSHGDGEVSAAS